MVGLLITGHGHFATELGSSLILITGNTENIAGSILPMLIEGSMMMGAFDSPLDMAESLIPTGKDYIIRFELAAHEDHSEDDGI